jgi:hypothetical protein
MILQDPLGGLYIALTALGMWVFPNNRGIVFTAGLFAMFFCR